MCDLVHTTTLYLFFLRWVLDHTLYEHGLVVGHGDDEINWQCPETSIVSVPVAFDSAVSLLPDVPAVNEWELDEGTDTDRLDSSTGLAGCQRQCGILINNRPEYGMVTIYVLYHAIPPQTKPNQTIE